ncbi:MAG: hypothetical protein Q9212_002582 [Teloschistes hypoglaucus]
MPSSKKPKERQPWLKRVLIPFWVFQSLFMLILIGVNVWEITETVRIPSVTTLIVMSFASVCMLLIIIEIVSFARRRLHPLAYLIYQVLKTTLWLTLFCISMVGIARNIGYGGAQLYLLTGFIEIVVNLLHRHPHLRIHHLPPPPPTYPLPPLAPKSPRQRNGPLQGALFRSRCRPRKLFLREKQKPQS